MTILIGSGRRSYSQLNTWLSCGMQYRLERVEKVPSSPAVWFPAGKAVHLATQWHDEGDENPAAYLWAEAWKQELAATRREHPDIPMSKWRTAGRVTKAKPNGEDIDWWTEEGVRQVQGYIDWRKQSESEFGWQLATFDDPITGEERPAIELELSVVFGGIQVKMFIDRVFAMPTGQLVVVDLKTGSRDPETQMQNGVYASGLERAYGFRPQLGAYFMTRKGTITVPEDLDTFGLDYFDTVFPMFERAVQAEVFIPHVSRMCKGCGVRAHCPAFSPDSTITLSPSGK